MSDYSYKQIKTDGNCSWNFLPAILQYLAHNKESKLRLIKTACFLILGFMYSDPKMMQFPVKLLKIHEFVLFLLGLLSLQENYDLPPKGEKFKKFKPLSAFK